MKALRSVPRSPFGGSLAAAAAACVPAYARRLEVRIAQQQLEVRIATVVGDPVELAAAMASVDRREALLRRWQRRFLIAPPRIAGHPRTLALSDVLDDACRGFDWRPLAAVPTNPTTTTRSTP